MKILCNQITSLTILCLTACDAKLHQNTACEELGIAQKERQCRIYFSPEIKFYKSRDTLTEVDSPYQSFSVDFVYVQEIKADWENFGEPDQPYWVKRSDLLFYDDFKKVTDCIPVSKITWESYGLMTWTIYDPVVNKPGTGIMFEQQEPIGGPNFVQPPEREFKVYYTKNLYVFRYKGGEEDLFYINYKTKQVIPSGALSSDDGFDVTWRSDDEMKHCKQVPEVSK